MKLNQDRKGKFFQLSFYFVLEISAIDLSGYKCLGNYLSREHHNWSITGISNSYNHSSSLHRMVPTNSSGWLYSVNMSISRILETWCATLLRKYRGTICGTIFPRTAWKWKLSALIRNWSFWLNISFPISFNEVIACVTGNSTVQTQSAWWFCSMILHHNCCMNRMLKSCKTGKVNCAA